MIGAFRRLFAVFPASDRWKLAGLVVLMLIGAIAEVVGIGMIPVFISTVASPDRILADERFAPILTFFNVHDSGGLLVFGGLVLVATFVLKNIYLIWFHYVETRFIFNRYTSIASGLFQRYMNAPYTFILTRNSSELLRNITQESGYLVKHVLAPGLQMAMDALLVISVMVLLLVIEPWITVTAVVLFALIGGGFLKVIRQKMHYYGETAQQDRATMIQAVSEGLGGLKDIQVLQREEAFVNRFRVALKSFSRAQVFRVMTGHATKPVLETIAVSAMLLVSLFLYWRGVGVATILPILALFGAATLRLLPTIREIVKGVNSLRYYGYSVIPIQEDYCRLPEGRNKQRDSAKPEPLRFERAIRLERASYAYPGSERRAVDSLTMTIPKGKAIGLIGPSGAGKTTVVDLLLGLLKPQSGRITVDGVDIAENTSRWLGMVGYIPQFIFLADDTVRRNVALGIPDGEIDNERLENVIEAAQLRETIGKLPKGIDTVIGERGIRLSGGQRQRIGIARALYENPQVLIMDEATSSLDHETESYVIESIERLKGERTIVMIAHRLTTIRNCDAVYMMKSGTIEDCGDYRELFERNPELRRQIPGGLAAMARGE